MLSDTLLDSSPAREPVLHGRHWRMTAAAAIAGFCLAWFGLPLVETPVIKVLVTQSLILAALSFLYALMLVYVYADSQHLKLGTWPWMALTLLLNIAGFIAYLVYSAAKTNNWQRATLPLAYMIEVTVIGVMVIIPLVYTQALPKAYFAFIPVPSAPAPAPPVAPSPVTVQRVSLQDLEAEPPIIPNSIPKFKHRLAPLSGSPGVANGLPGGQSDPVMRGMMDLSAGPQLPPPPPKPQTPKRVYLTSSLEAAKLIYGPKPDYPLLAQQARIQGAVRLAALISSDGTIKDLKVLSGHPLLVKAALDAVQQWRYRPTILNGQPVEVETEIDVNFALQQ